jgi:hypothetical protein
MRFLLFLLISIIPFNKNPIGKTFIPYYAIIGGADLIVQGKVEKIITSEGFIGYDFIINERLKSNTSKKTIRVKTYKGWTCEPRDFSKIKIGQEFLLFLTETGTRGYEVIDGSKGEISTSINQIRGDNGYYDLETFKYGVKIISEHFTYQGPIDVKKDDKITFNRIKGTKNESLNEKNRFYIDFIKYIKGYIKE